MIATDPAFGVVLNAALESAIRGRLVNWRFYRSDLGRTLCSSTFGTASEWRAERDQNVVALRALLAVRSQAKRARREWR